MARFVFLPLVCAIAVAATGCGDASERVTPPPAPAAVAAAGEPSRAESEAEAAARPVAGDPVARLVRRTELHARPGGRVVARLTRRTEFDTERHLAVVRRRAGWLGVIATERPNDRLGWIRAEDARIARTTHRAVVDLSSRRLRVVREGRTVLRIPVAVGAPGTATPTGRFAVTDALLPEPGTPYGCCILALTGSQPNVPQGWAGGDRLAVHGTTDPSSVGRAASAGCLRAHDRDLRRLMKVIELGSIVEIRR